MLFIFEVIKVSLVLMYMHVRSSLISVCTVMLTGRVMQLTCVVVMLVDKTVIVVCMQCIAQHVCWICRGQHLYYIILRASVDMSNDDSTWVKEASNVLGEDTSEERTNPFQITMPYVVLQIMQRLEPNHSVQVNSAGSSGVS